MKNIFKSLPSVSARLLAASGCLLILDFDGTLSPLAKTPARAGFPKTNQAILRKISRLASVSVAILSGRGLDDIKQKVGLQGISYAGNHGLEWEIAARRETVKIPAAMSLALTAAARRLNQLCGQVPGAWLENKGLSLSVHYRLVKKRLCGELLKNARKIIVPFKKRSLLKISAGKKVLEVRPALRWDKGAWVRSARGALGQHRLPIYIGDDATDEDVFAVLKAGVTIRVGKGSASRAEYYCPGTKQINLFLVWLLNELKKSR